MTQIRSFLSLLCFIIIPMQIYSQCIEYSNADYYGGNGGDLMAPEDGCISLIPPFSTSTSEKIDFRRWCW